MLKILRKKTIKFILVSWFFFFGHGLWAQVVQTSYATAGQFNLRDEMDLPPRTAAMGGAFVGVADDASALLFNPAGLSTLNKGEIKLLSDFGWVNTFQETALLGLPLGQWGGIGFAASYLTYGTLEGRDDSGNIAPTYNADAASLQAGWGLGLSDKLALGLALHETQQNLAGAGYSFFLIDVGFLARPLEGLRLGLDYAGAGWGSWNGQQVSTVKVGGSFGSDLDSSIHLLAAVGEDFQSDSVDYLRTGLEVSYQSRFFLRAGYQADLNNPGYSGFSMGAGLALDGFALDYAYLPYSELGDTNRFSLTYFFEAPAPHPGGSSTTSGKTQEPLPGTSAATTKKEAPQSGTLKPGAGGQETAMAVSQTPPPLLQVKENGSVSSTSSTSEGSAKDSLTLQFDIPPDYLAKGDRLEAQGLHSEAIASYRKAIQQDNQNIKAWWALGREYFLQGRKDFAVQCFEKVLVLRPDNTALKKWLDGYKTPKPNVIH
jgi:hypothetical protein